MDRVRRSERYQDAHLNYSSAIGDDLVIIGLVCGKDLHASEEIKFINNNNIIVIGFSELYR